MNVAHCSRAVLPSTRVPVTCPHCNAPNADDARFCGVCGRATAATEGADSGPAVTGGAPPMYGREIAGRYRIQDKLGEGGMGAVYKAEQISLKRTVAVKLLRPEVAGSQLLLRRFNAEAEAVAKLSHPNTVNIYDFGQDADGTLFIAMEFIEGHSLRSVIHREAPLPIGRALRIGIQVAAALTDAHAHSIIHRDLKPDNVMLQERGRQRDVVRVLDFGIAKLRDDNRATQMQMTQAGDMLGTPQYMAPEQIRAENIDGRTDVYALGCLLYEMVTARLPFEAPTVLALLSKHLVEVCPPPSQRRPDLVIPPQLDQLVMLAMAKEPSARPATMELFGEQLAALLASIPVDTHQITAAQGAVGPSGAYAARPAPSAILAAFTGGPGGPPTGGPPMGGPPTGGAPGHAVHTPPPPGGYVPAGGYVPPGGHVPPGPGAPPYDPRGGRAYDAGSPPAPRRSRGPLWLVLGLLVVGAGGVGAFVALRDEGRTPGAGSGSDGGVTTPPTDDAGAAPTADASTAADPWAGSTPPPATDAWSGGGARPPAAAAAVSQDAPPENPVDPDEPDEPDDPGEPATHPPAAGGATGLAPSCRRLLTLYGKMGTCDKLPAETRAELVKARAQMEGTWMAMQNTPEINAMMETSCKQGADGLQQSLAAMGCT